MAPGKRQSRRKYFVAVMALAGLAIGVGLMLMRYYGDQGEFTSPGTKKAGQKFYRTAPDFSLPDFQGKVHTLSSYQNKAIVLHFWASWCEPCLAEIPRWLEMVGAFQRESQVQFIAVSLDTNWKDAQRVLPSEMLSPYSNLVSVLDSSGKIPELYGTYQFPETYLLSQGNKIVTKWVGPQNWEDPRVWQPLGPLVKESLKK